MKCLIIEDHQPLCFLLSKRLSEYGFAVDIAHTAQEALAMVSNGQYDCMTLDLGLPDIDGIDLLKNLRNKLGYINPCLILSARDALQSRVDGLDAGADDYLIKPFEFEELYARLRALLRRPREIKDENVSVGNMTLSPISGTVTVAGTSVQLARREYLLLFELAKKVGWVVIKNQLEDRLYGFNEESSLNAVEAVVSRVRRKLKLAGAQCQIKTVRGLGYKLLIK